MLTLRPAHDRGRTRLDWLESYHTFSFAGYLDRRWMGFGPLRVLNDDRVGPGAGFATHGHREMEIITYPLSGALRHEDSTGAASVVRAGDIQITSAGRGIEHSEYNDSATDPVHFLQIWIEPGEAHRDADPRYEHRRFTDADLDRQLTPIVSGDGRDGSLRIGQDAVIYAARFQAEQMLEFETAPGRRYWLHIARGAIALNGYDLATGDAVGLIGEPLLTGVTDTPTELLLFDLPG